MRLLPFLAAFASAVLTEFKNKFLMEVPKGRRSLTCRIPSRFVSMKSITQEWPSQRMCARISAWQAMDFEIMVISGYVNFI